MTGKEPLTYYDMNLSAQDHQTFFTGDTQQLRPEDAGELYKDEANCSNLCNQCIHAIHARNSFFYDVKHYGFVYQYHKLTSILQ